jgi:membrane fusion protein, heavy metal efflux system
MRYCIFLFMTLIFACGKSKQADVQSENIPVTDKLVLSSEQMKNGDIKTGTVSSVKMSEELKVNGVVDVPPQNLISVSFPLGGFLKSTSLLPGSKVRKGEVIATMEDNGLVQLQQDYLIAVSKLQYAKQDYERQQQLNVSKANSDKVLQQAKTEFDMQSVMVRSLGEKLRLIGIEPSQLKESNISRKVNITSPINGYVSKVNVNIGRFVQPTEVLFELINPEDLHVMFTVFEKDLPRITPGQQVSLNFVDDTSKTYQAEVFLVTKNVDENRAGNVHCHFERMPSVLRPGMFVNGKIRLKETDVFAVPESAVVHYENKDFIFLQESPQQFRLMEVQTGIRENGLIEIISEESLEGKTVITNNAYTALMKMKNVSEEE